MSPSGHFVLIILSSRSLWACNDKISDGARRIGKKTEVTAGVQNWKEKFHNQKNKPAPKICGRKARETSNRAAPGASTYGLW